jgi:hypothetical protein
MMDNFIDNWLGGMDSVRRVLSTIAVPEYKWHHFAVSRWIREDSENPDSRILADAYIVQLADDEKPEAKGLRWIDEGLCDYPDPMTMWSGFVLATDKDHALRVIEAAG